MDYVKFLEDAVDGLETECIEAGKPMTENMDNGNPAHVLYAVAKIVLEVENRTQYEGSDGLTRDQVEAIVDDKFTGGVE